MTWFVKQGGYELFFNRDERISRSRAELPSVQSLNEVDYISPTDADAGGTWILVNQFGVTVCLLNHYQFEQIETYKDWISRGEIVRKFAASSDLSVAEDQFLSFNLIDYRAFRMFMITPAGDNKLFVWDGHEARVETNVARPKSSSSVDAKHVKSVRRALFKSQGLEQSKETQRFIDYHASHGIEKSKESVCMHRTDGNTVSFSHIDVNKDSLSFAYADGSPCEAPLGKPIMMKLVERFDSVAVSI
jgi:uncharacterized protein with NRDE domain